MTTSTLAVIRLRTCFALTFVLLSFNIAFAAQAGTPEAREARMKWWREARLGMFVHWGLYSGAEGVWDGKPYGGGVEWIQHQAGVPAEEYAARMRPLFKPKPGFAKAWARLAKDMGAQYVVFTSKHHEGFALWDSKWTDFDAKDFTGRDLFGEIVTALRAEGLRVGVYFSVIDWHHPDFPVKNSGLPHPLQKERNQSLGNPDAGRVMSRYVDFMHRQAEEIVSKYGKLDVLWWDWSSKETQGDSWRAPALMALVRQHQPRIIMNNRLYWSPNVEGDNLGLFDTAKGDFTTPEQHIPATGMPGVDWEACMTLNGTWGYSQHDMNWKSAETLIRNTVDIASKGGNYLINLGPLVDGSIPEAIAVRFRELGAWMRQYGESIHATTPNPIGSVGWGRITAKPDRLYLHVFSWPKDNILSIPLSKAGALRAHMLADPKRAPLRCEVTADSVKIALQPGFQNPYASVVVLAGISPANLKAQQAASGWQDLFDGRTLKGWIQRGGQASYKIEDGVIVGTTVTNTPNSFLCTEKDYGNFILELEFKVDSQLNSGIQIRSQSLPDYQKGRVHGYQVEIDPSTRAWTGGIYDEARRGWLNNLTNNPAAQKAFKAGEWNHFRIEARGDSLKTWLNGIPAADLKDSMTLKGFIALQVHSSQHPGLKVMWRRIRLQELAP